MLAPQLDLTFLSHGEINSPETKECFKSVSFKNLDFSEKELSTFHDEKYTVKNKSTNSYFAISQLNFKNDLFDDEIPCSKYDPLQIHYYSDNKDFVMTTNVETQQTGWVPTPCVKRLQTSLDEIDISGQKPQRLQQKLKDRRLLQRLARVLPQLKELEECKKVTTKAGPTFKILIDDDLVVPANSSMYAKVHPHKNTSEFLLCQPQEHLFPDSKLDIINGSYHEAHGGILMIHNYDTNELKLAKYCNC